MLRTGALVISNSGVVCGDTRGTCRSLRKTLVDYTENLGAMRLLTREETQLGRFEAMVAWGRQSPMKM